MTRQALTEPGSTVTRPNIRRGQCRGHELRRVLGPNDDVRFLAVQLVYDRADARAAGADAGAHRIDVVLRGTQTASFVRLPASRGRWT